MEKTYKILKLVLLVLVFIALILGAWVLYQKLSAQMEPIGLVTQSVAEESTVDSNQDKEETFQAPDFTVYDLDGNAHKLSDYRGKPVILNFWASWCGPCKSEMPDFDEKYLQYADQIHFLMVNMTDGMQETVDSASGYIADQGYSFPVLYDTDMIAAMQYGVSSIPVTYFIDSEGNLVASYRSAMSGSVLQQGIDLLMAE